MGKVPLGDFISDIVWYTTVFSFIILLFRRILKKKTIFDLLFRKRVKDVKQNIMYHDDADERESEFPSLFYKLFDRSLSIVVVVDKKNYSIINNFNKISNSIHQIMQTHGINKNFTYEFIIVNNNIMNVSDLQFLRMHPNVRIITLKDSMEIGTAIQIGSFAANGKFILYTSLSDSINTLSNFIKSCKTYENSEYCVVLPIKKNVLKLSYFHQYLIFRRYVDKVHDFYFDSFMISKKMAQIVLENIHFSFHESFNLEFLMILKYYRIRINEIPVDSNFIKLNLSYKEKIKSTISVFGLIAARFLDLYKYDLRLPLKSDINAENFYSRIDV